MANDKQSKFKLVSWKYDNGAWGHAVWVKGEKKWREFKPVLTKREHKAERKKICAHYPSDEIKKKRLELGGGLEQLEFNYEDLLDRGGNGFQAVQALLDSCGQHHRGELLKLIASILSAYCARHVTEDYMGSSMTLTQMRAPIITVSYASYAGETLARLMRDLALDTTDHFKSFLCYIDGSPSYRCKFAPVFPGKASDQRLTDQGYWKLKKDSRRMVPQYRDTAVMFYGWFFRGKDSRFFQKINPWVSLVLYNCRKEGLITTPVTVNGEAVADISSTWDSDGVRLAVARYGRYVARKSSRPEKWHDKTRRRFAEYQALIDQYNSQRNTSSIVLPERFSVCLQLMALDLFLKSCIAMDDLSAAEAKAVRLKWFSLLLPGCSPADETEYLTDDKEERDAAKVFEKAIKQILSEGYPDRFKQGRGDPEKDIWGYLQWYSVKRKTPTFCLHFRKDSLVSLLDQYADTYKGGGAQLYQDVRALCLDYLHPTGKLRLSDTTKSTETVMTLYVEKMAFLPEELRAKLQEVAEASRPQPKE